MSEEIIHKFKFGDLNLVLDVNSGAVHVVDALAWDIIGLMEKNFKEKEIQEMLKNTYNPFETEKAMQEIKLLKVKELLFSRDYTQDYSRPAEYIVKALCFHAAHDCNMTCRYCFAGQGAFGGKKNLMSRKAAFGGIDFLIENSGPRKNCEIDFFGGEPLLNFALIKETVDYARKRGREKGKEFKFTVTTNGLLLNEEIMDYLNDEKFSVVLSLDGRKEVNDRVRREKNGRGSYNTLVPRYISFVEKRQHEDYFIRGTYTRYNLDFSRDLQHMVDLGFKIISLEPVVASPDFPYALREDDLKIIKEEYHRIARVYQDLYNTPREFSFYHFNLDLSRGPCIKKRLAGCGAGTEYLALSPEGDLYPCHQFVGKGEFLMGNVLESLSFDRRLYHRFLGVDVNTKEECHRCWAKFFCGGGCHANAFNFNGDLFKPYGLGCALEKMRLECALGIQAYSYINK